MCSKQIKIIEEKKTKNGIHLKLSLYVSTSVSTADRQAAGGAMLENEHAHHPSNTPLPMPGRRKNTVLKNFNYHINI